MTELSIDSIRIQTDRFRDAPKVADLAASIERFGLLQPIVVEDVDGVITLIAGFRRLSAFKHLGRTSIPAITRDQLDPVMLREMELEENIQREQMTWQQKVNAISLIDSLKRSRDPKWTQPQTAAVVGGDVDTRDVSHAVNLTKMMEIFPELKKAKSVAQAMSWAKSITKKVGAAIDVAVTARVSNPVEEKILLGDSVELIKTIPDETFHAIITDPPFGIAYDDRKSGTESSLSTYEDSPETYQYLLTMAPDLYRTLKPDGWLVWFLGISWYERVKNVFKEAGFTVDEIPIIWDRSNGRTFTNRPDRYFTRGYDIALHCFKGDPSMPIKGKSNVLKFDPISTEERDLTVERPIELYAELIRRLTIPGQHVLDPFTGSGSCLAAAAELKRNFTGIELSEIRRAYAIRKVSAHYSP